MNKTAIEILRSEFEAEEGSFILRARSELVWDWAAFRRLTKAMYQVAEELHGSKSVEKWVAHAFWFFDTWVGDWTRHPNFPRPEEGYEEAIELLGDLAWFFFVGESPFTDDTLRGKCVG